MPPHSSAPRAVIFDVDGTLVDSAYLHTLAWWQAFRQAGFIVPMARIHRLVGMTGKKLVDEALPADRDPEVDSEILASHSAIFATFWPSLQAVDGARDLLARCKELGLKVVLATSARDRDLQELRRAIDADGFIDAATSSKDVTASKPEPDILLAALERVGVAVEHAVFVGDAVWDMMAAGRAGMPAVGVLCGGTGEAELREAGAAEVYSGPDELLAKLDSSAIGRLAEG
ncbi:HAD family hydrolase [Pseudarthrobacter sp. J64]|uniref:HAD family hydrolase n=1 Tax=Pseudarthrobacter sp. J64 TaxID=3116485 RepID=UPI002E81CFF6|nr:HAD family hydrolase [Pseudarthrobacter sp. J64]MEE2568708.1 HAD family hydrolase [Pseudarthrobacter sp. J64]